MRKDDDDRRGLLSGYMGIGKMLTVILALVIGPGLIGIAGNMVSPALPAILAVLIILGVVLAVRYMSRRMF